MLTVWFLIWMSRALDGRREGHLAVSVGCSLGLGILAGDLDHESILHCVMCFIFGTNRTAIQAWCLSSIRAYSPNSLFTRFNIESFDGSERSGT